MVRLLSSRVFLVQLLASGAQASLAQDARVETYDTSPSDCHALLQLKWANSLEASSRVLDETPTTDPAYGDDDYGLSPQDLRHPLLSLDGAYVRHGPKNRGIFHAGITWDSPHWNRNHHLPKGWAAWDILASAEVFDWTILAVAVLVAVFLRYFCLHEVAGGKHLGCHLASLGVWLLLAAVMAVGISLRFSEGHLQDFVAGYFFELFFMLENVFVFRAVIHAASLSDTLVARLLDYVVFCQIGFEAVFFLGLAHQLRSFHLLPQVLGVGLLFFGLSTLMESLSKSPMGLTGVVRSLSSANLAGNPEDPEEDSFLKDNGKRLQLTVGGSVLLLLLLVDFLCEIDTVLTKIEEIRSPFVAFSSSALAAFALPELYMLSQSLLIHFPLVKYGMGLILCLLGCQMILAPVVLLQPLLTCGLMLGIIILFIGISAATCDKEVEQDVRGLQKEASAG